MEKIYVQWVFCYKQVIFKNNFLNSSLWSKLYGINELQASGARAGSTWKVLPPAMDVARLPSSPGDSQLLASVQCSGRLNVTRKGTVAQDFWFLVFIWIDLIWAPDSHPKIFSNSVSNSRRYSYSKVKICESALLDTALIPNQCCRIQR